MIKYILKYIFYIQRKMKKRKIKFEYLDPEKKEPMNKMRNYPDNYEQFLKLVEEVVKLENNNKRYQLIEDSIKREIEDKEDFDLMTKDLKLDKIKIHINIVDKKGTNVNK